MRTSQQRKHPPHQVEIIAHRGVPREHPENSLPGFLRALALGADAIELDVHLTADGVPVVHHDPTVLRDRTSPGTPIARLTSQALAECELAPGVRIPTLAEVFAVIGDRATVYVEVKALGAEGGVVRCIKSASTPAAVHAFDHRVALRVAELAPELPRGILLASYLVDCVATLRSARARDYWQQWDMIDADLVARIHEAGGRVIAWTVNDQGAARHLRSLGVDGICTDVCGSLSTI